MRVDAGGRACGRASVPRRSGQSVTERTVVARRPGHRRSRSVRRRPRPPASRRRARSGLRRRSEPRRQAGSRSPCWRLARISRRTRCAHMTRRQPQRARPRCPTGNAWRAHDPIVSSFTTVGPMALSARDLCESVVTRDSNLVRLQVRWPESRTCGDGETPGLCWPSCSSWDCNAAPPATSATRATRFPGSSTFRSRAASIAPAPRWPRREGTATRREFSVAATATIDSSGRSRAACGPPRGSPSRCASTVATSTTSIPSTATRTDTSETRGSSRASERTCRTVFASARSSVCGYRATGRRRSSSRRPRSISWRSRRTRRPAHLWCSPPTRAGAGTTAHRASPTRPR